MLYIQHLAYQHANKEPLFNQIHLTINKREKIALIGQNGSGKSTLLNLISGQLSPHSGQLSCVVQPYVIPQLFGQYNHLSIAQALNIAPKLNALKEILSGNTDIKLYDCLGEDWNIEERCMESLANWGLKSINLLQPLSSLSGGEKVKVYLAGLNLHQPTFVLMDEPSNHLDMETREQLYDWIKHSTSTLLLVSHDKTLLNLVDTIVELNNRGIIRYGGNFTFYQQQKAIELASMKLTLHDKEKELRKAKQTERETLERQQRLNSRGKLKHEQEGVPKIVLNSLRNKAQQTTAKLQKAHEHKIEVLSDELKELKTNQIDFSTMKLGFHQSNLTKGKLLITCTGINHQYNQQLLWNSNLTFTINSGDRIAVKGANGSGKTTLLRLLLGEFTPTQGEIKQRPGLRSCYIDQDYSSISPSSTVLEQALMYNTSNLEEHEVKTRLHYFLFKPNDWNKLGISLSGGERMRLMLCCLTLNQMPPDLLVLDEPTNNLDLHNMEILQNALRLYNGTLIVISHDRSFLNELQLTSTITITKPV